MIKEHDIVVLVHDLPGQGLRQGAHGTVVMVHGSDGYEVEFAGSATKTPVVVSLRAVSVQPESPVVEHNQAPLFSVGDTVQRVNQPEAIGIVRETRWDEQAQSWNYSVQIGSQLKVVPEELLQPVLQITSPWDALRQGSFSGVDHFVFTLTFHRLRRPPTRIAYSFATSRTQFYPHQFKPLLKFLDNPGKRLLIADDVGLGKTIEAGYILRELQARQGVERVLVVVPARLTSKWKRELSSRFEEHFEIVGRSELLALTSRLRQGREPEPFKWIVSYESARSDDVRMAIDETLPPIDVLISDEAHRMRNSETRQHRLGVALGKCAEASIFLSATPVQNRLEDLWNLLRLLSSEEFSSWPLFQSQIQANALLLTAQRALAERPADTTRASECIEQFLGSRSGRRLAKTQMARSIQQRLSSQPSDRRDIVELQADIGSISPMGHVLSRTRKAEALPNRPLRIAYWQKVGFSPGERTVYESVEELCRKSWVGNPASWGFQMSLLMAYRMTASCIPAAMRYFAERLGRSTLTTPMSEEIEEILDEANDKNSAPSDFTSWPKLSRDQLADAVSSYDWKGRDSKLACLVDFLDSIWQEDDGGKRTRRKIVVFSYFRRTLEYLAISLRERGTINRMIHGGIDVDQRELAIDDFLERIDVPVLLTSEVGGEGIDLQRASIVVNYDLPWNPMVVEQRIGRVDRIGQESERIIVCNLVVEDSIEERVVQRLLDKLGIFRESIGELDPIIGEEIEKLGEQALRGELTEKELERAVEERGDALARQVHEARDMLSRVDGLLAADQGLVDEIRAVTEERQIPSERDLLRFLNALLAERVPGCQIPKAATRDVTEVDLRGQLPVAIEAAAVELGADASVFARRIMTAPIHLTLSREAGYRHLRAELIHLRHPLVRFAVAELRKSPRTKPGAFGLSLQRSDVLPPGRYGFAISLVEIRGQRPAIKLAVAIGDLEGSQVWSDPDSANKVVLEVLDRGQDTEIKEVSTEAIEEIRKRLLNTLSQLIADWGAREQRVDKARRELQRAAQLNALELRVQTEQERLRTLQDRDIRGFPIRMAEARLEKARRELAELARVADSDSWGGVEQEEIAVGILQVE